MDSKINVLGIYIDNYTGKEAMKEAVGYMESDPVNIVELLTVDAVMDVDLQQETKEQLRSFDLVLAGDKTILEAADVEEKRCLQETENHLFMKMFLRYLHKNHKRVYLLVETQEEGEAFFQYLEHYYRGIQIVGMAKVSAENRADDMLVNAINGAETDCVLSMLCSPLQEDFAAKNRALLNTRILFGMGKALRRGKRPALERKKSPDSLPGEFSEKRWKSKRQRATGMSGQTFKRHTDTERKK